MRGGWRLALAPEAEEAQREGVGLALSRGLKEENRILFHHSNVKRFYRVETPGLCLFVKVRDFHSIWRRMGRAVRRTKEERELENFVRLRSLGVPCPRPLSSARLMKGILPAASALVTEFIQCSRSLKEGLLHGKNPMVLDRLMELLVRLRQAKVVHRDLQWENLLLVGTEEDPTVYLVDPLHMRFMRGEADRGFALSIAWFLRFMIQEHAPEGLVRDFLETARWHGLCAPLEPGDLLEKARGMCDP